MRNSPLFSEFRVREDYYLHHYAKGIPTSSRARIVKVLEMARESTSTVEKLLDVGCGDGTVSVMLKHVTGAKEVYGIEISSEAAKLAEEKGVKVIVLDLERQGIPLPNDTFDLIYCGDIIEHIFEPLDLLKNLWRVLRKDGTCIITTPNLASWYNRVFLLLGYQPYGTACSLKISSAGKAFSGIVSNWGGRTHQGNDS